MLDLSESRKIKDPKSIAVLVIIAFVYALLWFEVPGGAVDLRGFEESQGIPRQLEEGTQDVIEPPPEFAVCGRATSDNIGSFRDLVFNDTRMECSRRGVLPLIMTGYDTNGGRTGNHLRAFLHAVQYARDRNLKLRIERNSWAMDVISSMFMVREGRVLDWIGHMEEVLCIKVFQTGNRSGRRNRMPGLPLSQKRMFDYISHAPVETKVATDLHTLRKLFQSYNTGDGTNQYYHGVRDMCSGIDSIFGKDERSVVKYSAIHHRYLEGWPGQRILGKVARVTGCDPLAALDMTPEYIKSILGPLDMLQHPIVKITDYQNIDGLHRLMNDTDIGPLIRLVPNEARWYGGDTTLGVMADVFIGNPASKISYSMSTPKV